MYKINKFEAELEYPVQSTHKPQEETQVLMWRRYPWLPGDRGHIVVPHIQNLTGIYYGSSGCYYKKVWSRFRVGLPTSTIPLIKSPSQMCPAVCALFNSRCSWGDQLRAASTKVQGGVCPSGLMKNLLTQRPFTGWSLTFSQYQPRLTPMLPCPMETRLRGLRRTARSMWKISVRPLSNTPPSRKIFPLFLFPLAPYMTK